MSERTLLFVDDEPTLGILIKMSLKHRGVTVVTATSGEEALKIVEADREKKIRVVFTDINMGETSGWELIERCREIRDDLRYMVITAEGDNSSRGNQLVREGKLYAFFDKIDASQQEIFESCVAAMVA